MKIFYFCKYCHTYMGQLDSQGISDSKLGFHSLTAEERADIITYDENENSAYVKTICDFCQQAIEYNPELSLVHNPLQ